MSKWAKALTAVAALLAAGIVLQPGLERSSERSEVAMALGRGDAGRAASLVRTYGCAGCHTIDGVPGADGRVGPVLADMRSRVFIGGGLRNTSDNLVGFIVSPETHSPGTAMPRTGITEAEARDVVTYLYQQ